MNKIKWHTKDGNSVPIDELSSEHLASIKKMLETQHMRNVESFNKCMNYVTGEASIGALDKILEEATECGVE